MIKACGSVLILCSGFLLRRRLLTAKRCELIALRQLAQLLLCFAGDIRLLRRTLPSLLSKRGLDGYAKAFVTDIKIEMEQKGADLEQSWCSAAEHLPLAEREKEEVLDLSEHFSSDAQSLSDHFYAVAQLLQNSCDEKYKEAAKSEKLVTTMCASMSIMLLILLI